MPIAKLNLTVIANSLKTVTVDGNYYFPRESLVEKYFKPSSAGTKTNCPWKGTAEYLDLELEDGKVVKDVAWYYATPKDAAANIKGYVAFYKNKVSVSA